MNAKLRILQYAEGIGLARTSGEEQVLVKKLFFALWQKLPAFERQNFLSKVSNYPHDVPAPASRFPGLKDPELEEAARWWFHVLRTLEGSDAHGFGKSFMKLVKEGDTPSQKEAEFAKSLYREWKAQGAIQAGEDVHLDVLEAAE
ncbi:hypothetical protein [Leisingera sp. ANG-M7]|uniref:hypothetical protein n=1 Tax=Leisingera sp. ANG-M7 TaxID=1577902 RepID=UPI000580A5A2|nr:hypothetical protein [Leisingera sp. ANG-M7]KIC39369.1 hypothetical protein RA26_01585 [Leisingera sp. ANG-M7]